MEQTELNAVQERRLATTAFYGYQRQKRVPDGYMTEDRNMTTDEYPCACVRQYRAAVKTVGLGDKDYDLKYVPNQRPVADALVTENGIAYLTTGIVSAPPIVWRRDKYWELTSAKGTEDGRLLAFGKGLFCPETGHYIPDADVTAYTPQPEDTPPLLKAAFRVTHPFAALPENGEGMAVVPTPSSPTAPSAPAEGDRWYDETNDTLKEYQSGAWAEVTPEDGEYRYDEARDAMYLYGDGQWAAVPTYRTYLHGIFYDEADAEKMKSLRKGDVIRLDSSDMEDTVMTTLEQKVITVPAVIDGTDVTKAILLVRARLKATREMTLTVSREYPHISHAVAHNNRIYGCVYDTQYGKTVNEIRVCRLGDPLSWDSYQGLEEDAFSFTVGEPGEWTGAAVLAGNPVFFKETCLVTVYGSGPSSYTGVTERMDGVAKGSERSLCEIDGALYYHSPRGIMRLYAGGYPICISDALCRKNAWRNAIAGTDGRKYYVEMDDLTDVDPVENRPLRKLYVYDTATQQWHIEDKTGSLPVCFVRHRSELLSVSNEINIPSDPYHAVVLRYISSPELTGWNSENALLVNALAKLSGSQIIAPWDEHYYDGGMTKIESTLQTEETISWCMATGDYGHLGDGSGTAETAAYKRVKEIDIRLWAERDAGVEVYIMYDQDGTWRRIPVSVVKGNEGTRRMRYRLARCDLYRLKLVGIGRVCVYSISQLYEEAGDRPGD